MRLLSSIKNLSIAVGLYKLVRLLDRKLRPKQQQKFDEDCNFYQSFINKGDLCFDVGANIGQKSEALLSIGARVVAIEPNPKVLPELEARC
jgi:16S rRNA A1518/A1519 N6-dimethyltransferase RsmA/KsgA/DIM1 with predicted DNA glycosylase/AP lyase activity